jgi:transcriptional regulator with XRE-family HTH domain
MFAKKTTPQSPYMYIESGLKNVGLLGINVHFCPECKTETAVIPKIGQLNNLIAKILMEKKELLTGEEIRYLRKYAGFPANEFSTLIDVDPSYLSRMENGKEKSHSLSGSVDKLVRALVAAARDQEYTKNILLQIAATKMKKNKEKNTLQKNKFPTLQLVHNRWQKRDAA